MSKSIACGSVVAAAVVLSGLGAGGTGALATASGAGQPAGHVVVSAGQAAAVPGTQLWVQRYNGPGNHYDAASSVAVSPDGGTVFVTGSSSGVNLVSDYATVAYNAATGAQRWARLYNGPGNGSDQASSVAVSPDGGTVFVTGSSDGVNIVSDYATVAYNAATGAQRWVKRYNGPGNGYDAARSVAVSPGGGTVFVTGDSRGIHSGADYATVAYNAANGAQRWVKRYDSPGDGPDVATSLAVSPAGGTVFVTGTSDRKSGTNSDYVTVAYNAATGARRWVKRYDGPGHGFDFAPSLAVSPAGGTVFVTGISRRKGATNTDYATVAYNAATGVQRWVRRYDGPRNGKDRAQSVAVSPAGGTVYVTGVSRGIHSGFDFATVAYNAATGAQRWVKRYTSPGNGPDVATSMAVSPAGGAVYVTGHGSQTRSGADWITVAYNAATGARRWVQLYNSPGNGLSGAQSVAVSPTGDKVFITGGPGEPDYVTVAYSG
jgi:WD40 repeat protein